MRLALPPQRSRLPCLPRNTALGMACCFPAMRVRVKIIPNGMVNPLGCECLESPLPAGTEVHMLPVNRDARLGDSPTTAPSQPVDECEAPPGGLQEARGSRTQ